MKKIALLSLLLISSAFAGAKSPVFAQSNVNTSKTEVISFVNNQNQYDIGNLKSFAINQNSIYLVNDSFSVYNKTSKVDTLLNYTNVTEIKQTTNYVVFKSNDGLKILKNNNEISIDNLTNIECDKFNVYEKNDTLYLSYTKSNSINILKIENGVIVDRHNTTVNSKSTFSAICLNDSYTYAILQTNSNYSFVKFNNLTTSQTALTFSELNCTGLELFETENKTYFVVTANLNQRLIVLTENNLELETIAEKQIFGIKGTSVALGEISSIADVKTYNNLIYVADTTNKIIQSFKVEQNNLIPEKIEIASASCEKGYFNNANSFTLVNDSTFLIADTENNRLQKIVDGQIDIIDKIDAEVLENPKFFTTNNNIDFYCYFDNKLTIFNNSEVKKIVVGNNISDLKIDENNNAYYIDYESKTLNIIKNGTNLPEILISNLPNDDDSKLEILNNNTAIISCNNTLYLYDLSTKQKLQECTINQNIIAISTDYYNNIYTLTLDGIIKINNSNNLLTIGNIFSYDTSNLNQLVINKIDGSIFAYNTKNNCIIKISNSNIVENLNDFEHEINMKNFEPKSDIITSATIKHDCYISNYPHNVTPNTKLEQNTNVFVIGEVENSYYIMYNQNNILNYGYISKSYLTLLSPTINPSTKVVSINKNTKIYKLPTILSDINNTNFNYSTEQLNKQLDAVNLSLTSIDNSQYYAVKIDNKILYVNASDVTLYGTPEIKSLPDLNAQIITVDNEKINLIVTPTLDGEVVCELASGQKIYVENFDASNDFTYITIITKDKQELSGYVETKYIKLIENNPNMTSAYILLGVSILIVAVSIIVYVKYKKSDQTLD